MFGYDMIYVIVDNGVGSKVLHIAKEHGITGGTIVLGRGTVNNSLLNFLSIYDERKEIVLMGTDTKTAERVLYELNKHFKFEKPGHGIAFSISTCYIIGSRCFRDDTENQSKGAGDKMYQIIFTIVNRGKAEDVIEAAKGVGSKGGTIINARGSGVNETGKLFNMEIEPEKEMVIILSKADLTENIVSAICEKLEIDKPGNGIVFVQDVKVAYGIYE